MEMVVVTIVICITVIMVAIILFSIFLPESVHNVHKLISRKYKAIVVRKKIKKTRYMEARDVREFKLELKEGENYLVDVLINGQRKTFYSRSLKEHRKLPTNREIIIYLSGKTIIHFEEL